MTAKQNTNFHLWLELLRAWFQFLLYRCFNWFRFTPSAIEKTQFDFQLSLRLHWDIFKILQVSRVPFCRSRYLFQVFDSNCICEILYISTTKWIWVDTGYKPRAAGWEARRLPLCYAAPKKIQGYLVIRIAMASRFNKRAGQADYYRKIY